jgi:hypothetical protein
LYQSSAILYAISCSLSIALLVFIGLPLLSINNGFQYLSAAYHNISEAFTSTSLGFIQDKAIIFSRACFIDTFASSFNC